jgi:thioredoxin 1
MGYSIPPTINNKIHNKMKQILYFSGKFCGPCRSFTPTMENISRQVVVNFVDVENDPQLVAEYGVQSVPTLVFLKNGQMLDKKVGVMSEQQVLNIYNSL